MTDFRRRQSPIWLQILLGAAVGALIIIAANGGIPLIGRDSSEVDASVLVLHGEGVTFSGDTCTGSGRLAALRGGAEIIIGQGDTVTTSSLETGQRTPEGNCRFTFNLDGIHGGSIRAQVGTLSTTGRVTEHVTDGHLWVTLEFGS